VVAAGLVPGAGTQGVRALWPREANSRSPRERLLRWGRPYRRWNLARSAGLSGIVIPQQPGSEHMRFEYGGLLGLLILVADIWAIINVIGSSASTGKKVLWVVFILLLPVIGFIVWFFAGPRSRSA